MKKFNSLDEMFESEEGRDSLIQSIFEANALILELSAMLVCEPDPEVILERLDKLIQFSNLAYKNIENTNLENTLSKLERIEFSEN